MFFCTAGALASFVLQLAELIDLRRLAGFLLHGLCWPGSLVCTATGELRCAGSGRCLWVRQLSCA